MNYQAEAEERLLRRIAEKTEEIKSLRDGLFNATSLLEASRSTTMNHYIIIFTIVTVIFLPPSFVATVFGTDLFNSEDTEGTITKFNFTTVGVSLFTYLVAILLVWLADRTSIMEMVYIYPWWYLERFLRWLRLPAVRDGEIESVNDEDFPAAAHGSSRSPPNPLQVRIGRPRVLRHLPQTSLDLQQLPLGLLGA